MNEVLLALGASLAWGIGDFVGPWQGRTLGGLRVLFWGQIAGLAAVSLVVLALGDTPRSASVLYAVPASISGTLGLFAYYRGMVIGAMAVVAPIAGAAVIVPVVFGILSGDRPSVVQYAGIACAVVGVVLASLEHRTGGRRRLAAGVGLALLAAIGFGLYFPAMHAAGEADPFWAGLVFRIVSTAVILIAVGIRRPALRLGGWKLVIVLAVGLADMLGNVLFAGAADEGGLVSLTSVLASLYPVVTVVLAAWVLHERLAPVQRAGAILALTGILLVAV